MASSARAGTPISIVMTIAAIDRIVSAPLRRIGVREKQLLAVDLVAPDRHLPLGRNDPIDESLPRLALHMRVALGVHQHDAVLVEQAPVALDRDLEVPPVLEREPRAAIG